MSDRIVIIGSGLAAYTLAKEYRRLEAQAANMSPASLTILTAARGEFYPKPMLSTALTHNKMPDSLVTETATSMAEQLSAAIHTEVEVTAIDTAQRCVWRRDEESPIVYDKLILATGSSPAKLPLSAELSDAADAIYSVNNLEDYRSFRQALVGKKRVAIIGAGLVGCEFANDLANAGFAVNVIAMADQVMERFLPKPLAGALQAKLAEQGVSWHLNCGVQSVNRQGDGYRLQLDQAEAIDVDLVLSAIGLNPNTALAKSAGIAVNRGVQVDRYLCSSDAHIYALGDCAAVNNTVMYFVAPLRRSALALAQTLVGNRTAVSYPAMPVLVKTPSCPTVVAPPPIGCQGEWSVSGEGCDLEALFYDSDANLQGFALTGTCTRARGQWAKHLPPIF